MEEALRALNQIVADGIVTGYAIGGAVGASSYIEAMQTEDLDAFVFLHATSSVLLSLTPIYEALVALGGVVELEHVRFGVWPLQILPDANPLITEAIREATEVDFNGVMTRIFTAEHLCAIALQTGRLKDYARVSLFLEAGKVDEVVLATLAKKYNLEDRLRSVQDQRRSS
jgi:hypothetical protein